MMWRLGDSKEDTNTESISLGDVAHIYVRCGRDALFGDTLCPECRKKENREGCDKHFPVAMIRGSAG